jgi:lipopolysaccharide/colanic/teichoic acid biosynthesis glycosyltransferase
MVIFMHSVRADRSNEQSLVLEPIPVSVDNSSAVTAGNWYGPIKMATDRILAALLLVLTAPLLLVVALLVKLTSPGPVIYSQVRLGRGGRPYTIHKIRTMVQDCEKLSGAQWSKPGDSRITWIGHFLRKTHIDELPQLWNVLRGEMSLIGPRPERPEFVPQLARALPRYRERLLILPGLSGLAQVQLPPDTDLQSVRRKLAHDLFYVERVSFWLDLRILLGTALNLLGLPYIYWGKLLALPGGEPVEQTYERGLNPTLSSPSLASELQPA